MRNAFFKSISHKIFSWLSVIYQQTMRIWEMKLEIFSSGSSSRTRRLTIEKKNFNTQHITH